MPWWGTVILTLGAALIGAGAVLAGTVLSSRALRVQSDRADLASRRQRGADVIAPILLFLDDIEPVRAMVNRSPETPRQVVALRERWETLREPLVAYAASHPSPAVLAKSQELITAVWNAFVSMSWHMQAMTEGMIPRIRTDIETDPDPRMETARADHHDARRIADEMLALIRETGDASWRASL